MIFCNFSSDSESESNSAFYETHVFDGPAQNIPIIIILEGWTASRMDHAVTHWVKLGAHGHLV
jgi:hypothetical protein